MDHGETEQRIALVLNGGVSLAVWMAGVVYEIDLLRRASTAGTTPDGPDAEIMERWRGLCRPAGGPGRRVVVDVIAGTSAGGVNGTLLATAIARGTTLDPRPGDRPWLSHLWVDQASLTGETLLSADSGPAALLSGKYFTRVIDKALGALTKDGRGAPVSLFVTATAMDPIEREYTDGYDGKFAVPDHRRMYRFENETGRLRYGPPDTWADPDIETLFSEENVEDFAEGNAEALKLATRGSASFPVAFPSVQETDTLNEAQQLSPRETGRRHWLADGGILDNAPFGPVLDAIAARPLTGDARRTLVYVVPSDGKGEEANPIGPDGPSWPEVAVAGLSYPREVDFRADIEQLEALLRESGSVWSDADQLFTSLVGDAPLRERHVEAARNILPTYRRARAAGGIREVRQLAETGTALSARPALAAGEVDAVLAATTPAWLPGADALDAPDPANPWNWGLSAAHNSVRLILQRLRDLGAAEAIAIVDLSLRRIAAVRERVLGELADVAGPDDTSLTGAVNAVFDGLSVPEILRRLVHDAVSAAADAEAESAESIFEAVLAIEVINKALHARLPSRRHAAFTVLRLGPDTPAPVLDQQSGVRSEALGGRKLYGTRAAHFGAFGSHEWRRRDWTWGRLDAVAHLGRMIGEDQGWSEDAVKDWVRKTQAAVLTREDNSPAKLQEDLDAVSKLRLSDLHDLRKDPAGRETLKLLADRVIGLVSTLDHPKLKAAGTWLTALLRREQPPGLTSAQKLLRWFTHPLRKSAWRWLAQAGTDEPLAPWYCSLWLHTGTFLECLTACMLSAWLLGNTPLAVLFGVLTGAAATTSTLLVLVSRLKNRLGKKIRD